MEKITTDKLLISSDFYSVQGEGISTGIPSYFVRLATCNLTCGMSRLFTNKLMKEKTLEDGEIFVGDLEQEGKATWTCDSTSQWLYRGVNQDFQYLIDRWKEQGIYEDIKNGTIRIIWTGGEPTIKKHQEAIVNFFRYWNPYNDTILSPLMIIPPLGFTKRAIIENGVIKKDKNNENIYVDADYRIANPYNEIETNGTIYIEEPLFRLLDQINCSPKLSNSGMTEKQRIVPEAIKRIIEHSNYQFKFVISNEEDIQEMFRDFIEPFKIPLNNVVCMPGMDSQEQFHERTNWVLEMAKKYKFRGLTRLHISAWDKTLDC
jgi:organic radical activating enzyme